jgi:G3E family GTPase
MSLFAPADARDRLPVSLVTGFLGSGKTTLLNRLIAHPGMANTAVVINEFGAVALDQHFIAKSDGDMVVMANGCLCCTVPGDFEAVVGTLFAKRGSDIPAFERLLIETTGLADPAPIMQMLLNKPFIADNFALDAVIATIDAIHGLRQLDEHDEAVKQAALADRIVITKTDLAADVEDLAPRIRTLNRTAPILRLAQDEVAPALLFGAGLVDRAGRIGAAASWLGEGEPAHDHLAAIETFDLAIDRPLEWRAFHHWLTRIKIRFADDLLRVKGIVRIAGENEKIAIHGVHHVFHPPVRLPRTSGDDDASRLVFITRGQARAAIEAAWRDFAASFNGGGATIK